MLGDGRKGPQGAVGCCLARVGTGRRVHADSSSGLALRRHTLAPALERESELASEFGDSERLLRLESAQETGDPTSTVWRRI